MRFCAQARKCSSGACALWDIRNIARNWEEPNKVTVFLWYCLVLRLNSSSSSAPGLPRAARSAGAASSASP
eukprot:9606775-Alexandrium_andersonii.AAC.1